ncbi:unnamed protein product [Gongylonema pulchrum]|uniref:Lig_chan-Glu_bd domain-containing protein n=1 Tax=Gongylonema pulchrum TaxID=637853 RepID=A0A183CY23_9BILA|nr:unnamed protein product [Gongylonema pulchrum]
MKIKFGNWSPGTGWRYDSRYTNKWDFQIDPDAETLEGLTLRVVVYVEEPFVIRAANAIGYDGYCIDLLIEMAKILKFNFTIFEGVDGIYGIEVSAYYLHSAVLANCEIDRRKKTVFHFAVLLALCKKKLRYKSRMLFKQFYQAIPTN